MTFSLPFPVVSDVFVFVGQKYPVPFLLLLKLPPAFNRTVTHTHRRAERKGSVCVCVCFGGKACMRPITLDGRGASPCIGH